MDKGKKESYNRKLLKRGDGSMLYDIGSFIHDLRIERRYSQEELCYGICSTGNLSKIENGIRMPNQRTIEALLQRLGCEEIILQFSTKEELQRRKLCGEIIRKLSKGDKKGGEEIVKKLEETIAEEDILSSQYCRFARAILHQMEGESPKKVIKELEGALRVTKPNYKSGEEKIKGLLTYNEIVIIANIANNYAEGGDNERALNILLGLKEYMETHVLDERELVRKYQMVIFDISNVLLSEERYDEAIELCDIGIRRGKENNRLRLFPYFLANKGFALLGKGEEEQAYRQLQKSYHMWDAMDNEEECERLVHYLKENWNFNRPLQQYKMQKEKENQH